MSVSLTRNAQEHSRRQGEHVIRLARHLADGRRAGILTTVGEDGTPHLRWMATLSLQEFPHLYALTSPTSRKISHLQHNPRVSWMFTNESTSAIVNLTGTARIVTDKSAVNRIWRLIKDKSNAFFLGLDTMADGIAVIDTLIENMECTIPRYDLHYLSNAKDAS